jgi:hypothetical protein
VENSEEKKQTSFRVFDYLGQLLFPSHEKLREKMREATEDLCRRNPPKELGSTAAKVK